MTALELERVRPLLEAEVQRLIDLLDQFDVDPDFEDGADLEEDNADMEPLLGAPNQSAGSWNGIDASFGCDDGEELELGWTEQEARWNRYRAAGSDVYEPSLGSNNGINQTRWSHGDTDDLEEQCEDEGAIDWDLEGISGGFSCYAGPCSPITTMVGQSSQLALIGARMANLSIGNPNMKGKSAIAVVTAIGVSQNQAASILGISQGNVLEFPVP